MLFAKEKEKDGKDEVDEAGVKGRDDNGEDDEDAPIPACDMNFSSKM